MNFISPELLTPGKSNLTAFSVNHPVFHSGLVTTLASNITEVCASTLPFIVAPVPRVIDVCIDRNAGSTINRGGKVNFRRSGVCSPSVISATASHKSDQQQHKTHL